jgi:NAD(P)-dependent dehydrogenase (short-subunit alcohol dehydrogenase family)
MESRDRVAIVTGATSGIGAGIARRFVVEGARVVLGGRRADLGDALAGELGAAAMFVAGDVAVEADVAALVGRAVEAHGQIDVVVSNAGKPATIERITRFDTATLDDAYAVNVRASFLLIKHCAPHMIAGGGGSIVTMATVSGSLAATSGLDYSVSKAALLHLTRWAAMDLGESGIRVNSISPGVIATGIFGKVAGQSDADADRDAETLAEAIGPVLSRLQPIGRAGTVDEVVDATLWLAGDTSSYVTGHDLVVDGGFTPGQPYSVLEAQRAEIASIVTGS